MPIKKLQLRPGVNKENTRYTNEGSWYDCDKVRFRYGTPEKIGGWERISSSTFKGVCRSMWPWATLGAGSYLGVGTNLKYYIQYGGGYNDITPLRGTVTLTDPFSTTSGLPTVGVKDVAHGCITGDFVTFTSTAAVGGLTITGEYQVTVIDADNYTITAASNASSTVTQPPGGGGTVTAAYQVNVGGAIETPAFGWGAGAWGAGAWGTGGSNTIPLRIWNHNNFGEDLIFGPKNGPMYYWDATTGLGARGVALSSLSGASDVPIIQTAMLVSDTSRFVLAFGCNDYGASVQDTMLIRWSDQESAVNWTPAATNQAGSVRLSHGSSIEAVAQVRQEILVWTDTALYSLQYLGPPIVWGSQLLSDNVSIVSDRAMVTSSGVTYWMGQEKFYSYDGRVNTLPCDLRQHVFGDFNFAQQSQIFAATVSQFNEIWWFYCSANSTTPDKYVVYNFVEKIWYYGTMNRTAWIDSSIISTYPISAYSDRLLYQEIGVDDNTTGVPVAIPAYITSAEFDIDDGHNFAFVWRVLPDITFRGSSAANPSATLTLLPLQNSGSGYNSPTSLGGSDSGAIVRSATVPVEQFTGQVNIRVRGRQMAMKIASDGVGVAWQLGSPRIDLRPDGRAGTR